MACTNEPLAAKLQLNLFPLAHKPSFSTRMKRGGGRGRGGRGGRGFRLPPVRPLESLRPVAGILRDDAIEIVDTDDMLELYEHGFFGKGTVSRRVPNRGTFEVLFAPEEVEAERQIAEAAAAAVAAAESGEGTVVDINQTTDLPSAAHIPSAKRPRHHEDDEAGAASHHSTLDADALRPLLTALTTNMREGVVVTDQMSIAASRSLDPRADVLTTIAADFETRISKAPLPEAFEAAAIASSHAQDPMSFEAARAVSHYISCPPPRTREASAALKQSLAAGAEGGGAGAGSLEGAAPADGNSIAASSVASALETAAGSSGAPSKPKLVVLGKGAPEGSKAMMGAAAAAASKKVQETSILEPEAAMFLMLNGPPGALAIRISPRQQALYRDILLKAGQADGLGMDSNTDGAAGDLIEGGAPLTPQQFWLICCARIGNFPARYFVYQHYRKGGWVVREGSIFGTDFVLYSKGPGWDHAPHCITVASLRLAVGPPGTSGPQSTSSSASRSEAAVAAMAPLIRAPPRPILSDWIEVHAIGRVVNNVKKHNIAAHVTMTVPHDTPSLLESCSSSSFSSHGDGYYYPPPLARLLCDPAYCLSRMALQTQLFSRWHMTQDMTRKTNAMMARAALAVTRAQEEAMMAAEGGYGGFGGDEGGGGEGEGLSEGAKLAQHIDLGLLEGHRPAPGSGNNSSNNEGGVIMNKQAVKHRVRQLLMAQQVKQDKKDAASNLKGGKGDGGKKGGDVGTGGGSGSSAGAAGAVSVVVEPALWPGTEASDASLANDIITYERVLMALLYPGAGAPTSAPSTSSGSSGDSSNAGGVPDHLVDVWTSLLSTAETARSQAEASIGAHFTSTAMSPEQAAAVATSALQRLDSLSLPVTDPLTYQPSAILGLVVTPAGARPASYNGFPGAVVPTAAPLSPLAAQQLHAVHHSLRTRLLAAALQPAPPALSELVEKAKAALTITPSSSSAVDDRAGASGSTVVNRGWYLRSAEWTKITAARP